MFSLLETLSLLAIAALLLPSNPNEDVISLGAQLFKPPISSDTSKSKDSVKTILPNTPVEGNKVTFYKRRSPIQKEGKYRPKQPIKVVVVPKSMDKTPPRDTLPSASKRLHKRDLDTMWGV